MAPDHGVGVGVVGINSRSSSSSSSRRRRRKEEYLIMVCRSEMDTISLSLPPTITPRMIKLPICFSGLFVANPKSICLNANWIYSDIPEERKQIIV